VNEVYLSHLVDQDHLPYHEGSHKESHSCPAKHDEGKPGYAGGSLQTNYVCLKRKSDISTAVALKTGLKADQRKGRVYTLGGLYWRLSAVADTASATWAACSFASRCCESSDKASGFYFR